MDQTVKDFIVWAKPKFPYEKENIDSVIERIEEEVAELRASPNDPYEIADIMFFCVWYSHLKGWDVSQYMAHKLAMLKNRTWIQKENGHYYSPKKANCIHCGGALVWYDNTMWQHIVDVNGAPGTTRCDTNLDYATAPKAEPDPETYQ